MRPKACLIFLVLIVAAVALSACGGDTIEDPLLAQGKTVFAANCQGCHPTSVDQPRIGPYLVGLGANLEASGQDAKAILEESIRSPSTVLTTGYQDLMPAAEVLGLSEEDIEALVAYLIALQ